MQISVPMSVEFEELDKARENPAEENQGSPSNDRVVNNANTVDEFGKRIPKLYIVASG